MRGLCAIIVFALWWQKYPREQNVQCESKPAEEWGGGDNHSWCSETSPDLNPFENMWT